jgi:iron(III) transport system substrate-binding protein
VHRPFAAPLILALVAACGGGSAPPPSTSANSAAASASVTPETVEQRLARLYEAAKPEGKVAAYWSLNTQFANPMIAKFEARFPGIKIEHTRANSSTLVQRLVTETRAGQSLADVVEMEAFDMRFVIDQRITQPYRPASWDDYPPNAKDPGGAWIASRLNPDYPAINTTKVKPDEIRTWKDLCDKKYEGKVAFERDQIAVYSALRKVLGASEAEALLQCLAANKASPRTGNTEIANMLAAGEYWIAFSLHAPAVTPLKYETKAPVDLVRTETVVTFMQTTALAAKPPHPNAARLFLEWILSPEGQQALADAGQSPSSLRTKVKYPELAPAKAFYITPDLASDFEKDSEFWRKTFNLK